MRSNEMATYQVGCQQGAPQAHRAGPAGAVGRARRARDFVKSASPAGARASRRSRERRWLATRAIILNEVLTKCRRKSLTKSQRVRHNKAQSNLHSSRPSPDLQATASPLRSKTLLLRPRERDQDSSRCPGTGVVTEGSDHGTCRPTRHLRVQPKFQKTNIGI